MHTCEICGKEFETESALRGHKLGAHKADKAKEKNVNLSPKLTSTETAIAERAATQDDGWFHLTEDDLEDFSLMQNPLDLPPEAAKEQNEKRLAFRWCERTPERVDQLTRHAQPPLRWAICNRNTTPFLKPYIDDLLGCVTSLDQVLLCKPWSHHMMVQQAKQELANVQDRSGTLSGKKDQIAREGTEVYEGKQYRIGDRDEVMADEGLADLVAE